MRIEELGKEAAGLWVIWSKSATARGIRVFIMWALACELLGFGWGLLWAWHPWITILCTFPVMWFFLCTLPVFLIRRKAERELRAMGYKGK